MEDNNPGIDPVRRRKLRSIAGALTTSTDESDVLDHSPQDLIGALLRNRAVIVWAIAACLLAGLLFVVVSTPQYRAETLVLIEPQAAQAGDLQPVVAGLTADAETVQSESYIIASIELASRIFDELNLASDPEFSSGPGMLSGLLSIFSGPDSDATNSAVAEGSAFQSGGSDYRKSLLEFHKRINVGVMADSRVISIRFRSTDPQKAEMIANALASEYLNLREELKLESSGQLTSWLGGQIQDLMMKVQDGESQIQTLRQEYGIVEGARGELSAQEMAQVSTQLIVTRAERASVGAQLEQAQQLQESPTGIQTASEVLNSPLIQDLRTQEIALEGQLAEQGSELGEQHPRMVQLRAEIEGLRSKINTEIANIVAGLENQYNVAMARERSLEADLNQLKQSVAETNQREIEIRSLERDVEANQTLLTNLLRRQKETEPRNQSGLIKADARVISRALPPGEPFFPNVKLILGSSVFVGLVLGGLIILLIETLNSSVRSLEELDSSTGVRALGFVPKTDFGSGSGASEVTFIAENPRSAIAESIRTIIWNIKLTCSGKVPQVLAFVSATSGEGKTTMLNLFSITQQQSGSSVVAIDADIRRPNLHLRSDVELGPGLSEYLSGEATLDEVIRTPEAYSNISVIPAGNRVDNVSDLLGSERMDDLVTELRERYDQIYIDTPPVIAASDAQLVGKIVDAVVMIVKSGHTSRKMIRHALDKLSLSGTPFAGAILSAVDVKTNSYYGYFDSSQYSKTLEKYYGSR